MPTKQRSSTPRKTTRRSPAFEAGLAMRKKVLGEPYVARAMQNTDPFWMPFQEVLTEAGWGAAWTRPGLPLKTRSMLTLAMCIALNRPNEIRIHLRGAIRNGVTPEELRELVLHSFVYCGGPASLDAYHTIKDALPAILEEERPARRRVPAKKAAKKAAKRRG